MGINTVQETLIRLLRKERVSAVLFTEFGDRQVVRPEQCADVTDCTVNLVDGGRIPFTDILEVSRPQLADILG